MDQQSTKRRNFFFFFGRRSVDGLKKLEQSWRVEGGSFQLSGLK